MRCPDCRGELADTATYCGCGWKRKADAAPVTPRPICVRCPSTADVKIKVNGIWLFLCHACDSKQRKMEADEYCKTHGLNTIEKQKAWLLQNKLTIKKIQRQREPGDDDEPYLQA